MLTMRLALLALFGLAFPALAQLDGRVVSPDGALEGVVVSARKAGSPVTTSVVSGADGRFSFPAAKLEPGSYALRIRATGYELEGPQSVEVDNGATRAVELKLRKSADLSAQREMLPLRETELVAQRFRHGERDRDGVTRFALDASYRQPVELAHFAASGIREA